MLRVIRSLLLKIVDDIDAGNSNISEGEAIEIVDSLKRFTDKEKRLSKYAACEYLNVSRATFDNYVREGKLPRGKHEIGFKELSWSKKELDEFVKKCRINQRLRSNPKSEIAQQSKIRDCLIALIEFIEVIRRRRYDNPKEDDNTYI
jgi:predicted DNA-binding transcriptional regulator AlpA